MPHTHTRRPPKERERGPSRKNNNRHLWNRRFGYRGWIGIAPGRKRERSNVGQKALIAPLCVSASDAVVVTCCCCSSYTLLRAHAIVFFQPLTHAHSLPSAIITFGFHPPFFFRRGKSLGTRRGKGGVPLRYYSARTTTTAAAAASLLGVGSSTF